MLSQDLSDKFPVGKKRYFWRYVSFSRLQRGGISLTFPGVSKLKSVCTKRVFIMSGLNFTTSWDETSQATVALKCYKTKLYPVYT